MVNGSVPGIEDGYPGPDENVDGTWTPPAWPENDDPADPGRPIIIVPEYEYLAPDDNPEGPVSPWPGFPGPSDPEIPDEDDPDDGDFPPELNPRLFSNILIPSVSNISDAIQQVIECNCDCWLE